MILFVHLVYSFAYSLCVVLSDPFFFVFVFLNDVIVVVVVIAV